MSLRIRRARNADIAQVQRIAARTISACFPAFLDEEQVTGFVESGLSDREIVDHKDNLFVLTDADRILGFSIVFDDFIHLMMIDSAVHGSGHGSRLLAWCEARMRASGHSVARLETFAGNVQAVSFYRKHGWTEASRDGDDAGRLGRAYYTKKLS